MTRSSKRLLRLAGIAAAAAAAGIVLERFLIAGPHYRGAASDHYDGKRFHNHQSGWQSTGSVLKWQLTKDPTAWPEWIDEAPGPAPERSVDDGRVRITFVNHATMLVQMDGVNILTDPIWSERCSPVSFAGPKRHRAPGLRFEELPPIDAVLVSHNHYDHLDLPTLRRLQAPRQRETARVFTPPPVITPLGNAALLARNDVRNGVDLDWWEERAITDRVKVTLVPSQHFCARGISDRNATLWGGFVISGPSGNVYFAGDTGWGKHFAEVQARFGDVRVALLPIGAYLPRWFMKPAHISPDEAVDAHRVLGARTSIAMHFGTFALGDDGEQEPVEALHAAIIEKKVTGFMVLNEGHGFDAP